MSTARRMRWSSAREAHAQVLRRGSSSLETRLLYRYGFQTSTRVRLLVMLTVSDMVVKDLDMITVSAPGPFPGSRPTKRGPSLILDLDLFLLLLVSKLCLLLSLFTPLSDLSSNPHLLPLAPVQPLPLHLPLSPLHNRTLRSPPTSRSRPASGQEDDPQSSL